MSSTFIVVLLNVFYLSFFSFKQENEYVFSIFSNATIFLEKMGEMPIGIDMVAYVYNRLVDGASSKSISNALQINDSRQLQGLY